MTDTAPLPPPPTEPQHDGGPHPFSGRAGRTLRRSRTDRTVAGVAGGLGRWLDVDPTILRVLFVVLAFFGGAGFVLYGVAWLVVPEEGADQAAVPTGESVRNAVLVGAVVVALGVALGADSVDGRFFPWPLLVLGAVLATVLLGRDGRPGGQAAANAHRAAGPGAGSSTSTESVTGAGAGERTVVLEKPAWYPPAGPPPPPPPPRRSGPLLFGPALALLAIALGALGLYDVSGGDVVAAAYPALALALVGLLLVVGAFVGRPGGLVLLGLVAAVGLLVTAVVDPAYSGPRELELRPTTPAALDDTYRVPAGRIELDLTGLDPAALDGRSLDVSVGAGEVVVLVPASVRLEYDAAVDFGGEVEVGGRTIEGWSPELHGSLEPTDGSGSGAGDLVLRLAAEFGQLQVVRS